jgi:hypothetical protein
MGRSYQLCWIQLQVRRPFQIETHARCSEHYIQAETKGEQGFHWTRSTCFVHFLWSTSSPARRMEEPPQLRFEIWQLFTAERRLNGRHDLRLRVAGHHDPRPQIGDRQY